jgi:hypothetical protein
MKRILLQTVITAFLLTTPDTYLAGQVRIGGGSPAARGALLDLNSPTKGSLLLPNVTLTSLTEMPAEFSIKPDEYDPLALAGAIVYNTNTGIGIGVYLWIGTEWLLISPPVEMTALPFSADKATSGNSIIDTIKAAPRGDGSSLTLRMTPMYPETVTLTDTTDLDETGLVLTKNATSPDTVTLIGGGRVIDLTGTPNGSPVITVGQGVTLILRKITFKGLTTEDGDQLENTSSIIKVESGGHLILEAGATLEHNHSTNNGGGVYVADGGTFNMNNGATINSNRSDGNGGGVYVAGDMFEMTGGSIGYNISAGTDGGGGVYVADGCTFNMTGGSIEHNDSNYHGGGVYVSSGGTFNMTGETISGNRASALALSGVYVPGHGGGVYVAASGKFNMTGGTIRGNRAMYHYQSYGGGVYAAAGGTFTKSGNSTIYGYNNEKPCPNSDHNAVAYVAGGGCSFIYLDPNHGHAVYDANNGTRRSETTLWPNNNW